MQAGKLKRPIVINVLSTTQDEFGQQVETWTPLLQTWAEIVMLKADEVYALTAGFNMQLTHKITLRFHPAVTITQGMQVAYRGRTFVIQTVSDPDEQRKELDLLCLEQSK